MADNYTFKDASNATQTGASKDIGSGVQAVKHVIIDPTTPTQQLGIDASGRATVNVSGTVAVSLASAPTTAITVADGSNVALGAKADTAATTDTGTFTLIALFKRLLATYFAAGLKILSQQGAANISSSQVTTGTSAATLAIARATRRSLTIKNTDAAITVTIGPATVTALNGTPIKAGESITLTWVGLVQAIAASGTPVLSLWDEYD